MAHTFNKQEMQPCFKKIIKLKDKERSIIDKNIFTEGIKVKAN